uniref:Ankyrin repeat protein-like protein n=1 Tax=Adineta vaga TaxID=104782 RepID=B3G4E7_ADIVA|nr:ankyrin repeat protein-like protein [Adineta vaga]
MCSRMSSRKKTRTPARSISEENKNSELYWACKEANIESMRQIASMTDFTKLNELEPNGSTALHAACASGHVEIVHALLNEYGVMRHVRNQYGRTAYEVAASDEICQLFHRSPNSQRFQDHAYKSNMQGPTSVVNESSENKDNENDNETKIRRLGEVEGKENIEQIRVGIRLITSAASSTLLRSFVLQLGRCLDPENRFHDEQMVINNIKRILDTKVKNCNFNYNKACVLLTQYEESGSLEPLCTLYTLDTPFYSELSDNTSGYFALYFGLCKLTQRAFQGRCYRGFSGTVEDVQQYKWAHEQNDRRAVYTRSYYSSSTDRTVAECFADPAHFSNIISILVIYEFPELCSTAIRLYYISSQLPCISEFENENEVLITPGTLFKVIDIQISNNGKRYTLYLQNISAKWKLRPLMKCLVNCRSMLRKISE